MAAWACRRTSSPPCKSNEGDQPSWTRPCAGLPRMHWPGSGPHGAQSSQEGQIHRPVTTVWTMTRAEPVSPCTVVQGVHHSQSHELWSPLLLPRDMQKLRMEVQVLGKMKACPHLPGLRDNFWKVGHIWTRRLVGVGTVIRSSEQERACPRERVSQVQPFGDPPHHFCRIPEAPALLFT